MNVPVILKGKAAIPCLLTIRRKVDKATKRADEVHALALRDASSIANDNRPLTECRHVIGMVPNHTAHPAHLILRGAYSDCYPASIAETTQTMQRPEPWAVTPTDARVLAIFGEPLRMADETEEQEEAYWRDSSPLSMEAEPC